MEEQNNLKLKCIEIANGHPNRKNDLGKVDLAMEIMNEIPQTELNKLLEHYGYKQIKNN